MFNSCLIALSTELNNGTFQKDDFLVDACREYHLSIIRTELEMWQDQGGSDETFMERFESAFPPGFIRRDLCEAKNVIYDLYDIANSTIIRYELKPIYTYVMYQLVEEWPEYWSDNMECLVPKGLKAYLKKKACKQTSARNCDRMVLNTLLLCR